MTKWKMLIVFPVLAIQIDSFSMTSEIELSTGYGISLPSYKIKAGWGYGYYNQGVKYGAFSDQIYRYSECDGIYNSLGNGLKLHQSFSFLVSQNVGFVIITEESIFGKVNLDFSEIDDSGAIHNGYIHFKSTYFSANAGLKLRNDLSRALSLELIIAPGLSIVNKLEANYLGTSSDSVKITKFKFPVSFSLLPSIAISKKLQNGNRIVFSMHMFVSEPVMTSEITNGKETKYPMNSIDQGNHGGDTYSFVNLSFNIGWCFSLKSRQNSKE
jgi:hypothetical protein